ncbi:MAG: hypothetical protein AMJ55_08625 [Gammaproteobacteria bacterium SG8_15]|nr:MAG: hypothetical protein AMJ55_08625 [Gammaproteobacteria bacterium SG8_15]
MRTLTKAGLFSTIVTIICALFSTASIATSHSWQFKGIAQSYYQSFDQSLSRESTFNLGIYWFADYLDNVSLSFGYNYTFVDMSPNIEVDEHILHLGGKYSWFSDTLSGKFSLALDGYGGKYTTTTVTSSGGGGMGGMGGSSRITSSESTDISVLHPQVSFINYAKTYYFDIGYAYSEYDSGDLYDIEAHQITPTLGFGWNNAYDWLQLRGYFINLNQQTQLLEEDDFASAELKYIHWFVEKSPPYFHNLQLTLLAGDRVLAVDPDAKAVYSVSDKQTGSVSVAGQWALTQSLKFMFLVGYDKYENDLLADEYDSLLFYANFQNQW